MRGAETLYAGEQHVQRRGTARRSGRVHLEGEMQEKLQQMGTRKEPPHEGSDTLCYSAGISASWER